MSDNPEPDLAPWREAYRKHVLETGAPPASVFAFCAKLGVPEEEFFARFPNLESFEGDVWAERVRHVRATLAEDPEYGDYPPRQKVLAFLFTFLEAIRGQRSWYLARFPRKLSGKEPPVLRRFRSAYGEWAKPVAAEATGNGELAARLRLDRTFAGVLYAHFRSVIKFNLEDESEGFERTDAFVEKSTRLLFDLAETDVPESAADLFRFLAKRTA